MSIAQQYIDMEKHANREPQVHELLDDPITQLLMQTDGVQRTALDPMLQEIMDRMQP